MVMRVTLVLVVLVAMTMAKDLKSRFDIKKKLRGTVF